MEAIREISGVAAVLGLLGAMLWLLRRRGLVVTGPLGRSRSRQLECVERLALGPQHAIHLVRLGDRGLLIACSASGCALVDSFPWREFEEAREARP